VKEYFVGGVVALALAVAVVAALLLFTDLRVTDQSVKEVATSLLLEGTDQAQVPDLSGPRSQRRGTRSATLDSARF
jgi:hypothetical protein